MTHSIKAIISKDSILTSFSKKGMPTQCIELPQNFSLLKLTDELLDEIDVLVDSETSALYEEFYYLSSSLDKILIEESRNKKLAYIETDYFGGVGSQAAILYENGLVALEPLKTKDEWNSVTEAYIQIPNGVRAINFVLNRMGVVCQGKLDEFDSIQLGQHRH